jgi:hypothetical protein
MDRVGYVVITGLSRTRKARVGSSASGSMNMDRDEAEYLRKLQEHVAETRRLFSNTMKPERERMVCRAFLRCVGIKFCDQEIIASDTEPVDVVFRSAKFQIRELLGSDRKRGDELKELQEKVQNATSIEDV